MIGGAYLVSWQTGFPQSGCPEQGPRPVNFNVSQRGNQLSVLVGGEELRGTLYDTYDFSLTGGRALASYSLRGRAVVDTMATAADAGSMTTGARLYGTLFTRTGSDATPCDLSEGYAADRL